MFKNYFKTTVRNLWRNKAFSVINILGLSLGMAASLLIFLWMKDELSVDAFHKNKQNIYAVYESVFSEGKAETGYETAGLLATELKRKIPEIQYASSFDGGGGAATTFELGDKIINMRGGAADSDFFKLFDYKLLQGTASTALDGPDKIAISRKMAEEFFGSADAAINKSILYNNSKSFVISAVFENIPSNSSDQFDYLVNYPFYLKTVDWVTDWVLRGPKTYISLFHGSSPERLNARIKNFMDAYLGKEKEGAGLHYELGLQRFDEMYLNSNFKNGRPDGGRIAYVRLFSIVAVFILLIACINFMNLSTARSVKRAKEVGVRKTVGALRSWLIIQFIGEAMFFTLLAIIIAIVLVLLVLPVFNGITGKQMVLPVAQVSFWYMLIILVLLMGFVAGSYPALFLSSLNPIKVLKGSLKFSLSAVWFRKGLVIFQFALSIILIIGTMVVAKQINYVQTQNIGFDREDLIYVPLRRDPGPRYSVFKQEISGMPGIKEISRADQEPTAVGAHAYDMDWTGKNPNTKTVVKHITVCYGFLKLLNLKLLQGRDFSRDFTTDTAAYIINETALKLIGYRNPIGQPLSIFQNRGKIIGVIKDFHFLSLHDPIEPLVVNLNENTSAGYALIRAQRGKPREAIASLESVYKQLYPKFPFTFTFSDDEYQKLYKGEQMVGKLSTGFAFLAIFISCLGLLGLVMFTAEQRTKEIGVRKVLGASEIIIFRLLSKDFLQLVGIAFIIAAPIAWLVMNSWLLDYAYRTTISWWLFAGAGAATVLIALLTVSFQAVKAALANPVKSLRAE